MKKYFKILSVSLVFILLISFAISLDKSLKEADLKKPKPTNSKIDKDIFKPNFEFLDYYEINDFKTSLPVVHINTGGSQIKKSVKTWAKMGILKKDLSQPNRLVSSKVDEAFSILINLRGASSYSGFDKEQYRFEFYQKEEENTPLDYPFLNMPMASEWVLNGPYLDVSLMRNKLLYDLGKEIFVYSPSSEFCEVFVDGQYKGVYLAVEPITSDRSRLNLAKFGLLSGESAYIINRDRIETKEDPIITYGETSGNTYNSLYISYPSYKKITTKQVDWIKEDVSKFEKVLYSENFDNKESGYSKYIDVDNFVDYFIFNEVTMNRDAGNLSTYAYKNLNEKMKLAIWDYNNAYDNYQWFESDFNEFRVVQNSWFDRLIQDKAFVDKVVKRYYDLRLTSLDKDYMYSLIKGYEQDLKGADERNFKVWGYVFNKNMMSDPLRNITSHQMGKDQLRAAIALRFEFLDKHIKDLYKYTIN